MPEINLQILMALASRHTPPVLPLERQPPAPSPPATSAARHWFPGRVAASFASRTPRPPEPICAHIPSSHRPLSDCYLRRASEGVCGRASRLSLCLSFF